jgi:hypothetical protein
MGDEFTVGMMAARLERANPTFPAGYYARQIRGWAQHRLFGLDVKLKGEGPTAAQLFRPRHLAMAKLFSTLTRLNFEANALRTVTGCFHNITAEPSEPEPPTSFEQIVARHEQLLEPEQFRPWFLVLYATESGDIASGLLTQHPRIDATAAEWMSDANAPNAICLNVSRLWLGLFDDDETFERYRADRERFEMSLLLESKRG